MTSISQHSQINTSLRVISDEDSKSSIIQHQIRDRYRLNNSTKIHLIVWAKTVT